MSPLGKNLATGSDLSGQGLILLNYEYILKTTTRLRWGQAKNTKYTKIVL